MIYVFLPLLVALGMFLVIMAILIIASKIKNRCRRCKCIWTYAMQNNSYWTIQCKRCGHIFTHYG